MNQYLFNYLMDHKFGCFVIFEMDLYIRLSFSMIFFYKKDWKDPSHQLVSIVRIIFFKLRNYLYLFANFFYKNIFFPPLCSLSSSYPTTPRPYPSIPSSTYLSSSSPSSTNSSSCSSFPPFLSYPSSSIFNPPFFLLLIFSIFNLSLLLLSFFDFNLCHFLLHPSSIFNPPLLLKVL